MAGAHTTTLLQAALLLLQPSSTISVDAWNINNPCCQPVAHADCWGFQPGKNAAPSIQAAIDCPLAHTVVVKDMGTPWIVGLPRLPLPVVFKPGLGGTNRAAMNFSSHNQLIIFEPGVIIEAQRWSFHGFKDCLGIIGSEWGAVHNVTIHAEGAVWRMWKQDYQCYVCPPTPAGGVPCVSGGRWTTCPKCEPKSSAFNQTECYAKSEWRHGLNLWAGVDITITGLTIESSGGDGIETGAGIEGGDVPGGLPPGPSKSPILLTRNIVIRNVTLSNNHRQGISVISAEGLLVEDSIMKGTNGTAPEGGVDIEPDNSNSILMDIVFRRCQFVDNNGGAVFIVFGNEDRWEDAPISILFEDCDASWRDNFPFQSPYYDAAGYMIAGGPNFASATPGGTITIRGGTVQGSAGAGIGIYKKPLSGPVLTFADVNLIETGKLDKGVLFSYGDPGYVVHVTPIMLMDHGGGIGGLWFQNVRVVMAAEMKAISSTQEPIDGAGLGDSLIVADQPFLSYNQWPCDPGTSCPNVTGEIGGNIVVQWRDNATECVPRLLGTGGVPLGPKGTVFGHELLENVSITCLD